MQVVKLACLLLIVPALGHGALPVHPYEWEKDRSRYILNEKEKALAEYVLKLHTQYDYAWEGSSLTLYQTHHSIIRVTNAESIERHNRIYVSMRNVEELVDLKARAINKDGKTVYFDKDNLKEIKDEETGAAYRKFAMEGIEADSELEYFYTVKLHAKAFETIHLQTEVPIKKATFVLSCPNVLSFQFRVYNDSGTVRLDTAQQENHYAYARDNVPALKDESFSSYNANRARIEFKLAYNKGSTGSRLNTWADAAKTFYKMLMVPEKDDLKAIDKFIPSLKDNISQPLLVRIKHVEDEIKNSVQLNKESSNDALGEIPSIIKMKQASTQGLAHLLVLVYQRLNIPVQIVLTCSREDKKFDGRFDTWAYLEEYLLYFPGPNVFLSPADPELRIPLVPAKYTSQKGLFVEPITIGEVKSALASIREIPELPFEYNTDDLNVDVSFDADGASNTIKLKRSFAGFQAAYMTRYHNLMTTEQKLKFVESLIKDMAPDLKITKWTATPSTRDDKVLYTIDVEFTSEHFLEKAGNRWLFKAGELIGPQVEMYRDDERQTPVENANNRGYDRRITINLPAGLKINNADDLKINVAYKDGEQIPYIFESDYSLKGNILTIKIDEYYKRIHAPLSRYEDFRKVVNASADFNKVTLVLEPKL